MISNCPLASMQQHISEQRSLLTRGFRICFRPLLITIIPAYLVKYTG
jgi:hypothetical protein